MASVYVALGDVLAEINAFEEARKAYQQALTAIPLAAEFWRARLHWKLATTWVFAVDQDLDSWRVHAQPEFMEAERILHAMADHDTPEWREEWIALQFAHIWPRRNSAEDMLAAIEKARPLVEQHGSPRQRRLLAESIGIYNAVHERYVIPAQRIIAWRERLAALEPSADEAQRGIDLTVLGIGLWCASQFDEAEEQLNAALQIGERTGNAWLQNNCLTFLSLVYRRRGQVEAMRQLLVQAQAAGVAQQNSIFSGHQAWLAWRAGDLEQAESYGRAALLQDRYQLFRTNAFMWTGRWPLIGIALIQERYAAASAEIRLLFDTIQQPPPAPLEDLLQAALRAWDDGKQNEASSLMQSAVPLAEQLGYL
ncbi:hypothetical protein [Dictyobacter kobayashii]|nr:hypothetical protein [Dictyobacter kobayashii]